MLLAVLLAAVASKSQTAWRTNAMSAGERLGQITAQKRAAKLDATTVCDEILQTAYALHLTKPELVEKQNEKAEYMHLTFDGFDLVYVYDRAKDELVGARIMALPKDWVIAFAESDRVLVSTKQGCVFDLDTKRPFAARVFTQKP